MVQSVELLLDPTLAAAVREEWRALVDAGLPSQARHTGKSNAPHITLAVTDSELPALVEDAIASVVALPIPLRLGGLMLFGSDPYVLARPVVPTHLLLAVQSAVVGHIGVAATREHVRPGTWSPHVTLAHRLDREAVIEALTALAPSQQLAGQAVAARRWDSKQRRSWLIADSIS